MIIHNYHFSCIPYINLHSSSWLLSVIGIGYLLSSYLCEGLKILPLRGWCSWKKVKIIYGHTIRGWCNWNKFKSIYGHTSKKMLKCKRWLRQFILHRQEANTNSYPLTNPHPNSGISWFIYIKGTLNIPNPMGNKPLHL